MKITKELLEQMIEEAASEYVYGVKNPGRVANQYKIKTIKKVILEELSANLTEDGHEDTSSAIRKLKTSIEDAGEILQGLQAHHGDLPSWWMGKVTIAADYLNKARDYFLVSGDVMQEENMEEDPMGEIFSLTHNISSNILHLSKEDRATIERDLNKIRDLADPMELDEVASSEKQRRWACAQMGDNFKGERSLSKKEAEKMCKDPVKPAKKG